MKKIAYIELDTHAEIASNFMELIADSQEFSVDYYFSEKILKQIGVEKPNVFQTECSEILNSLRNTHYDLVIIGTVHRYFNVFNAISKTHKTAAIVHNLNFSGLSKFHLFKNIFKKQIRFRLKLWWKEGLLSAPEVYENLRNLLVLDESLSNEKFSFLPIFFNEFNENADSKTFTIVIPGTVSQERRDYEQVIKKTKELEIKFKTGEIEPELRNLEIIFLGKAKGEELRWLKDLEQSLEYVNMKYFTEKVPRKTFDEWMNKANVLWCPIQPKTEFFSNTEIYGKTKMSGNIGDAIKYGKMAFFPKNYPSNFPFIMHEGENNPFEIFSKRTINHYDFQEKFSREKIRTELENTLRGLL